MTAARPPAQAVEVDINDGSREQRQHLADDQSADDRDSEGPPQFGPYSGSNRQR